MPRYSGTALLCWPAALSVALLAVGCRERSDAAPASAAAPVGAHTLAALEGATGTASAASSTHAPLEIETPPPPFSEGIFPCSACHAALPVDPTRRVLSEPHTNIVFEHAAKSRWCLDCHAADDRDKLHLASGQQIEFSQSYRLCGQCHGPTFRDWKAGVHGKRVGEWNGRKQYYLCAHCHNPHSPKIKPLAPFPAPQPPEGRPFVLGDPPAATAHDGDSSPSGKPHD